MILFLSSAFLRRLRIQWKPELKGFLLGDRNLFFFYPDSLLETSDFSQSTVDSFLRNNAEENIQLLGFLTPVELDFHPQYAEVITGNTRDPHQWKGRVHLLGEQGPEYRTLEIAMSEGRVKG